MTLEDPLRYPRRMDQSSVKSATGALEVICGPMFSGKTTELLRRVKRAEIAGQRVLLLKPLFDTRYASGAVVTHEGVTAPCVPVGNLWDATVTDDYDVIAIDEVQFFERGSGIEDFPYEMVEAGVRVIVAGLDVDSEGRCFGDIPYLLAQADQITKLSAVCNSCGADASRTYRAPGAPGAQVQQVLLGEKEIYEARCRACWRN